MSSHRLSDLDLRLGSVARLPPCCEGQVPTVSAEWRHGFYDLLLALVITVRKAENCRVDLQGDAGRPVRAFFEGTMMWEMTHQWGTWHKRESWIQVPQTRLLCVYPISWVEESDRCVFKSRFSQMTLECYVGCLPFLCP